MNKFHFLCCLIIFLCCVSGCSESENRTTSTKNTIEKSNSDTSIVRNKFSKEEVMKAYGNINFGIDKDQYRKLLKENQLTIDEYKYDIIPFFDQSNELYMLVFKGREKDIQQFKNEQNDRILEREGDKVKLTDLIEKRYGQPQSIPNKNVKRLLMYINGNTPNYSYNSVQYDTFSWSIDTKKICVGLMLTVDSKPSYNKYIWLGIEEPFLDLSDKKLRIYPVLVIYDENRLKELNRFNSENDSIESTKKQKEFEKMSEKF